MGIATNVSARSAFLTFFLFIVDSVSQHLHKTFWGVCHLRPFTQSVHAKSQRGVSGHRRTYANKGHFLCQISDLYRKTCQVHSEKSKLDTLITIISSCMVITVISAVILCCTSTYISRSPHLKMSSHVEESPVLQDNLCLLLRLKTSISEVCHLPSIPCSFLSSVCITLMYDL